MSAFLDIKNVHQEYTNNEGIPFVVLDDVSLQVEEGSFVCLLGPSGCGKSTLLKMVGGFEVPTSGEVIADGKRVERPGSDRSMVFQTFEQLLPWKTILQNIEYPLKVNKLCGSKEERHKVALEYLDLVGLSDFGDYYPHQVSGGMKQRAAIARSVAQKPKFILMDEPFASVDAQTRTVLQRELYRIWQKTGVTIIFITHNIQEAIILGSKIVMMSKTPANIVLEIDNPVEGTRQPGSPGFDETWQLLSGKLAEINNTASNQAEGLAGVGE